MRVELRGKEAQCPCCGRVFTSDVVCEKHKKYVGNRTICTDPIELGMVTKVASYERGFEIWTQPIPEELKWWSNGTGYVPKGPQELVCESCGVSWERPAQRGRKPKRCEKCRAE